MIEWLKIAGFVEGTTEGHRGQAARLFSMRIQETGAGACNGAL